MYIELPVGRIVRAAIKDGDAIQIVEEFGAERRVDGDMRIKLRVHFLLQQGRVEMSGIDNDEAGRDECYGSEVQESMITPREIGCLKTKR